ncbi:MAG TPA: DUF305 domain-containing protein [Solirubrobacteraceae bacterium]|nr:DUF305 domain-containing protein [Solirubrobacteraceae bacterium]
MLAAFPSPLPRFAALTAVLAVISLAALALAPASPARAASSSPAASSTATAPGYTALCRDQSKRRLPGTRASSYSRCVSAMAKLASGQTRSARKACDALSRRRPAGARRSPYAKCLRAAGTLLRAGNAFDRAYVAEMIPHHESAVEMAEIALDRAQSTFVRNLASDIIVSQKKEIATMRQIAKRLADLGVKPRSLGLSKAEMGMDHDASHLRDADPFDHMFIDMMIPHHQGALTMSDVLLARGTGVRTKALAKQIITAQTREIEAMERHHAMEAPHGSGSPSGSGGTDAHH